MPEVVKMSIDIVPTKKVSLEISAENIAAEFLKRDQVSEAISIVEKITPSQEFASLFAKKIFQKSIDEDFKWVRDFVSLKEIADERITYEEADAILRKVFYPNGILTKAVLDIPDEIFAASSKKIMATFFRLLLENREINGSDKISKYWGFLAKKIKLDEA